MICRTDTSREYADILALADPVAYGLASRLYDRCAATLTEARELAAQRSARSWIYVRPAPPDLDHKRTSWVAPYRVIGADVPTPPSGLCLVVTPSGPHAALQRAVAAGVARSGPAVETIR